MKNGRLTWDAERARKAIAACFPSVKVTSLRPIYSGWDNFVVEVNDDLIFRFPMRPDVEKLLEREMAILPWLRGALPISVPDLRFIWRGRPAFPSKFVGYTKIRGVGLSRDVIELSPARIASQIARLLNSLQGLPTQKAEKLGLPRVTAGDWKEQHEELFGQVQDDVFPLLNENARRRTSRLFSAFLRNSANFRFEPAIVHSDLNTNILCDPVTREVTGVLDWDDMAIGDPAFDFSGFLYDAGEEFVDLLLRGYSGRADRTFWRRMRFYSMLIPYKVVLGAKITNRSFSVEGDEVVLGEGHRFAVFKMFKPASAFEVKVS